MPLQPIVAEPALAKVNQLAEGGHDGAVDLATYWVGQGVGLMTESLSAGSVVQEFKKDFINAYERFEGFLKE
jgi:NAD(P)H-dependent flavin oxidoreductase YrpB (nitropropane dioxygenase family)